MKTDALRLTFLCLCFCLIAFRASATTYYVDINSTNATPPYTNWSTAATDIQSAVNAANNGDLVLVNPGLYQSGGETEIGVNNNRVSIKKPMTVMSVSGPAVTTIAGGGSYLPGAPQTRCVYMTNGAVLIGFTLTAGQAGGGGNNGTAYDNIGGGVFSWSVNPTSNVLYDCILMNNYASNYGGGGYGVEFVNCLLAGNSSVSDGSAAEECECINCTIVGNNCRYPGAVVNCTLINCIDYYNGGGDFGYGSYMNCCISSDPGGINIITNAPDFENLTNGDYHLQAGSPCINAGTNSYITTATDLDGNPRIFGGIVDIGAYEYQLPTIAITEQPATQTNILNQTAMFNVAAVSPYPLSYQWLFNSNSISGATNSSLVVSNLQIANSGSYSVAISNSVFATNSANAYLSVFYPSPAIIQQPANTAVILGSNTMISITATSYLNMTFQWQLNGTNLTDQGEFSGSTTTSLFVSGAGVADAGNYDVIVSDSEWTVTSAVVSVSILFPATITLQPTNQTAVVPHNVSFSASASGTGPLGFQWYFDGTPLSDGGNISGSGSSTLNISGVQLTNAGVYQVLVTNSFSEAASAAATLMVLAPVQILTEPTNEAVLIGNTAELSVFTVGTPAPGYQWYFNGAPLSDGNGISGSSTANLTITDVQSGNGGNYWVVVSNIVNTVTSTIAALTPQTNPGPSIRFVNVSNSAPASPYLTWSTAATNFQNAIDASISGDTVIVTDGVYQVGGAVANGYSLTNRVLINKNITVESVNGPANTIIEGNQLPIQTIEVDNAGFIFPSTSGPNGPSAIRCVCITTNAALIGFTLTNGATLGFGTSDAEGGGVWCALTNGITISNCVIIANGANYEGGGAFQGTLLNCTVLGNSSMTGGGAANAAIFRSLIISNTASSVNNNGNNGDGGGTFDCAIFSSAIADNYAYEAGGGAYGGYLVNCTVTANFANAYGGGTASAVATNSIIYYNKIFSNTSGTNSYPGYPLYYCCTTPNAGGSNISAPPALADISHISLNSPCRGAGEPVATDTIDIDGNSWASPPSIGCSEIYPGTDTGIVTVAISTSFTNWAPGYPLNFQASISGPVYNTVWNFGDGTIVSNQPYVSHTWTAATNYPVTLTAYNDSYPTGVTAALMINIAVPTTYYVNLANPNPIPPYTYWSTAATTIQDAVNVAVPGSTVLVTNPLLYIPGFEGRYTSNNLAVYQTGGTNAPDDNYYRVVITNAITVESVNGPATTYIYGSTLGGNPANCIYLANGATLSGFLVTNYTENGKEITAVSPNALITNCVVTEGTVVNSGTLESCLITGSSYCINSTLSNSSFVQGGSQNCTLNSCIVSNNSFVDGGTLNNCILINNTNSNSGGGAAIAEPGYPLVLNNCILSNNTALTGGGVDNVFYANNPNYLTNCILNNCILTHNFAQGAAAAYYAELNNCLISNNTDGSANPAVIGGQLVNCTLIGNSIGAVENATLTNCALIANTGKGGANGCTLYQCTLSQNVGLTGGGADDSILNNCLIISNLARGAGGGGAYFCELTNCIVAYNAATNGGGAYRSTLVNCTVIANTAVNGGGIYDSTANNCILYYNINGDFSPNTSQYPLNYCCVSTQPANGIRNITNAPLFVNLAGGDYHLQSQSPCINSGNNAYINAPTDLDGNLRIQGGTVDIGAYEFQTPTSVISYAYLQQYGLPTDGSVDFANLNGTAFNVYQDWIAGLNPTNPASVLAMLTPTSTNTATGVKVTWQSVSGIPYFLQRSTNLISQPPFTTIQSNITGQTNTTTYTDTTATGNVPYFYRVGVVAP